MKQQVIPLHVFERLEREWRLIDPERPVKQETVEVTPPVKTIKIGRVD